MISPLKDEWATEEDGPSESTHFAVQYETTCTKKCNLDGDTDDYCHFHIPPAKTSVAGSTVGLCSLRGEFLCLDQLGKSGKFKIVLSHSGMQEWLRCRRRFWYKYIVGLEQKKDLNSDALKMGSLWDILQGGIYEKAVAQRDGADASVVTAALNKSIADYLAASEINQFAAAKVRAMYRAHLELIEPKLDDYVCSQQKFWFDTVSKNAVIHGIIDRRHTRWIAENKFTGNPKNYDNVWSVQSQVGAYFMSDPSIDYVMMELAVVPGLKPKMANKTNKYDELPKEYCNRLFDEIMANPRQYFPGYEPTTRTYGIKFHRNEFNLEGLMKRMIDIAADIYSATQWEAYYFNDKNCMMYGGQCEFKSICESDCASEQMFGFRGKGGHDVAVVKQVAETEKTKDEEE